MKIELDPDGPGALETARATEAELGRVLDASLNEFYIFDADSLLFQLVNRGARENLGYRSEQLLAMTPVDLKPGSTRPEFEKLILPLRTGAREKLRFESVHRRCDGTEYDVEVDLQLDSFHGHPAFIASILDVTQRKEAEAATRDNEERSRSVLETAPNAIVTMGEDRLIQSVNPATVEMFGYLEEEMIGQNVSMLMPSPYRERHDGYVAHHVETGERKIIGIGRQVVARRRDGSLFPIDLSVGEVLLSGGRRLFTGIIRDISDYKELERKLLAVSEHERRNIGRDIHDDLCQRFFGIRCLLQALQQKLTNATEEELSAIEELSKLITDVHLRAREMAHGLMPVALEADGLMAALKELTGSTQRSCGIRCTFECVDPVLLDDNRTAVHLYRIAQEAVGNAVRHGSPSHIEVALRLADSNLVLEVSDDGNGLPDQGERHSGMGMLTMSHRARMLGGHCEVIGRDGAVVTCIVPLPAELDDVRE